MLSSLLHLQREHRGRWLDAAGLGARRLIRHGQVLLNYRLAPS